MKKKSSRPGASARRDRSQRQSGDTNVAPFPWWPAALLAAFVALLVARTLVPEDPGGRNGYGAPFVTLWLLATGIWLLGQLRRGTFVFYAGWPDVAMLALVAWHTASALVAFRTGAPRPALNMLWDWVAMGVAYFLARQVLRSPATIRAAMVVMIGLACGLSAMAVHQSLVTLPAARAAYESIKNSTDMIYQHTGQWMPPGSSVRQQFESRLASGLSTATFALSNSLAGFLVPWLVVLGGILFAQLELSPNPSLKGRGSVVGRATIVVGILLVALMAWCIVLTGSRSAGIAALAGLLVAAVPLLREAVWPRPQLRRVGIAMVCVAAIGAAVVAATTPGRNALSSAWRSLAFRAEYWQATAAMIADDPLWGCGPGQFQDTYTAYKLPSAAEEVQDPHNWLLEIWATAGTPAAIAVVVLLVLVVARAMRGDMMLANDDVSAGHSLDADAAGMAALTGAMLGVALGTVLAWWNNFALLRMQILLLATGIVGAWWLLGKWIRVGPLPTRLPLIAAGALLVNLLVAGGIGFPSVADSLWLLVAIELNLTELAAGRQPRPSTAPGSRRAKLMSWAACLCLAGVLVLALRSEYLPVMGCRWRLRAADDSLAQGQVDLVRASLDAAVAADPWSSQAAERLASLRFDDYEKLPTAQQLRSFREVDARALSLAPRRSGSWEKSGQYFTAIHDRTGDVEHLRAAADSFHRAIELYPSNAEPHARLALLLASAERADEAEAAAAEALRLDDQLRAAGHMQQLLEPALRSEVEALVQQQP